MDNKRLHKCPAIIAVLHLCSYYIKIVIDNFVTMFTNEGNFVPSRVLELRIVVGNEKHDEFDNLDSRRADLAQTLELSPEIELSDFSLRSQFESGSLFHTSRTSSSSVPRSSPPPCICQQCHHNTPPSHTSRVHCTGSEP